jgi:hypothetical protein
MDSTGHAVRQIKDSTYFNAIKWNIAGISLNNISLLYERTLNQRWSVQMGASYKYGGDFPEFLGLTRMVIETEHGGLTGFSVTPEGRYYFQNKRHGERLGLYAGVYGRVTEYQGKITFLYWDGSEYIDIGGAGDMWEYGLGLQLGYQLNLGRHWLVDLMFMGPRTSFHSLKLELESDFVEEVIPIIEEELNERLAWWGMDPVDLTNESTVNLNFRFNNFRYYVGIGYRF